MKKPIVGLAVLGLVAGSMLLIAGPASAHNHTDGATCQAITIDLDHYDEAATVTASINGENLKAAFVNGEYHYSQVPLFNADHTSYTLQVDVVSQDAGFSFSHTDVTPANCYTAPPPVDVCPNIDGNQTEVPAGYVITDGQCVIPPPAAQSCTAVAGAAWYAEDRPPTQAIDGLKFTGNGSTASDWYFPVSGNLQGLGNQSLTFSNVTGYQPSLTVVFFRNGGTSGYANLVAEWYENGGSPDTAGTFTIDANTKWWTNKIASGPGSITEPATMSTFTTLWPNNNLGALGAHLGSSMPTTTSSTLTAITGCVNATFAPTPLPEPHSTYTEWVDGTYACGDATVTQTRTRVDITYTYDDNFIPVEHDSDPVTETQSRDLTADELLALNCPTATPTPTPEPTTTPVATTEVKSLVTTGVDPHEGLWIGIGALSLGLIFGTIAVARRTRRTTK